MKMRNPFVVLFVIGLYAAKVQAEIGEFEPEEPGQSQVHEYEPELSEEPQEHEFMIPGEEPESAEQVAEPHEPEPAPQTEQEPQVQPFEPQEEPAQEQQTQEPVEENSAMPVATPVAKTPQSAALAPAPAWHGVQEEFPAAKSVTTPPAAQQVEPVQPAIEKAPAVGMPVAKEPTPTLAPLGLNSAPVVKPFEPFTPGASSKPEEKVALGMPTQPISTPGAIGMPMQPAMPITSPVSNQVPSYPEPVHAPLQAMPVAPALDAGMQQPAGAADADLKLGVTAVHQIDLDTLSIEGSGNWLEKRIWYEKAEQVFTKLRGLVAQTVDASGKFLTSSNVAFEKVHTFYATAGVEDGKLEEKISICSDELQAVLAKQGDLNVEEKAQRQTITQSQQELKQISKSLKFLQDIEDKIDETVQQAFKTVAQARSYETKAWNNFVAIAKEIDDKKARSLYYEMESFEKNIVERKSYLEQKLLPYLQNELIQRAYRSIQKVQDLLQGLQQKGIDVQKKLTAEQAQAAKAAQEHEKSAHQLSAEQEKQERDLKARKTGQEKGFLAGAKRAWSAVANWSCCVGNKIVDMFCDASCFIGSLFTKKTVNNKVK